MSDTPTPPTPATPPTPPTAPPPPDQPTTFTQEQVEAIVGERLGRHRVEVEGLKAKAAKLDALEATQLTETERLTRELEQERSNRTAAEQRAADALRRSAVVSAAQRAGAVDPDAVLALLPQGSVTVGDDGTVTGVDEAVSALLATKPYLVGKPPAPTPGGADGGARNSGAAPDVASMTVEQYAAARRAGTIQ